MSVLRLMIINPEKHTALTAIRNSILVLHEKFNFY